MSNDLPAQLKGWIDCPRCGRIEKPTREFRLPKDNAEPMLEKLQFPCQRCGSDAVFYIQRVVSNIH
jgi:hypothetical protein